MRRRIDKVSVAFVVAGTLAVTLVLAAEGAFTRGENLTRHSLRPSLDAPGGFGSIAWDATTGHYLLVASNAHVVRGTIASLRLVEVDTSVEPAVVVSSLPLTLNGAPLSGFDLDVQDIALAPDGTIWAVDELKPSFLHIDRDARVTEQVAFPASWKSHIHGRGPEGIAISPDGGTLFAIRQNGVPPEPRPSHTVLLAYNISSRSVREYSYWLDTADPAAAGSFLATVQPLSSASGLVMIDNETLLVLEHGELEPNVPYQRVYAVQVPPTPPPLPLGKRLVLDLFANGFGPLKPEAITLKDANTLAVVSDNGLDPQSDTHIWTFHLRI